jgi:hypothetical protein
MDPKRAAYVIGTVVLVIVDLIALNDITTASVSVTQVAFLVLSIPVLVALAAKALSPSRPEDLRLPRVSHHPRPR